MEDLVIYQSADQTFVVHVNDEAEFVARFFGEDGIDWEEWDRFENAGPVEIGQPAPPEVSNVYDSYDI